MRIWKVENGERSAEYGAWTRSTAVHRFLLDDKEEKGDIVPKEGEPHRIELTVTYLGRDAEGKGKRARVEEVTPPAEAKK